MSTVEHKVLYRTSIRRNPGRSERRRRRLSPPLRNLRTKGFGPSMPAGAVWRVGVGGKWCRRRPQI